MNSPKLTVIIPTRERADTLFHTLRTVLEQEYENLEIIVSDNASIDNTRQVVSQFTDVRLRYINTGNRIGMSENWEFALSHVTGDFVMFLGDDDGLLPNSCADVASILKFTNAKALIWNKPNYSWPSISISPNQITLQCSYDLCKLDGHVILKGIASGRTSYGRLPVLYAGFVSMISINNIKARTGNFFHSITPDVYSGIVLAEELKSYLYSFRPFSINAGSRHSNGIASVSDNKNAQKFFTENKLSINKNLPIIRGSIQSHIAESFLQAKDVHLLPKFQLNINRIHYNIICELRALDFNIQKEGLTKLLTLSLNSVNRKLVEKELKLIVNQIVHKEDIQKHDVNTPLNGQLHFNCDSLYVENSYDASKLIGTIIGKYKIPVTIKEVNYFSFILIFIKRKLSGLLSKYLIPV